MISRAYAVVGFAWGCLAVGIGVWMYVKSLYGMDPWPASNGLATLLFSILIFFAYTLGADMRPNAKPLFRLTPQKLKAARLVDAAGFLSVVVQIVWASYYMRRRDDLSLWIGMNTIASAGFVTIAVHTTISYAFTRKAVWGWLGVWLKEWMSGADDGLGLRK